MLVLESQIEKAVVEYAKKHGVLSLKLYNAFSSGWPDRLFITKQGRHFYIEFKKPGEKPRTLQLHRMEQLRNNNCVCYVCDTYEQGEKAVNENLEATSLPKNGN